MKTKKLSRNSRNGNHEPATPRRLLVPVDFSDMSLRACQHAARLAAEWHASLTLVHVVARDDGWLEIGREEFRDLDKALEEQATHELRALAKNLAHGVKPDLQVRIGRPVEEIAAAASETKADLIVLSTHGRTGFDRYFMGSVAERLTRLAPCPLFLMPVAKAPLMVERSKSTAERPKRKN